MEEQSSRLLLAIVLSLLVLTAYQMLFGPRPAPRRAAASPGAPSATAVPSTPPAPETPPPSAAPPPSARPAIGDEREKRVEVVAPDFTLAFSNRGARLVSWQLERYRDARGRPEEMVLTVPDGPRPLDVQTGDAALDVRLNAALFRASSDNLTVPPQGETSLDFEFSDGEVEAQKTLRFEGERYLVEVSARVRRGGRELPVKLLWGPGVGNPTAAEMEVQGYQPPQGVALTGSGVEHIVTEKMSESEQRAFPSVRWVGVESRYFAAVLIPTADHPPAELRAVPLPRHEDEKARKGPAASLDLGTTGAPVLLYVGPKDYQRLSRLGHELNRIVPVGEWIGPIVVPLMAMLRWVHSHVGNYGWSIVLLTVLINLAMSPFRHYSIANGVKMAKLSPEMRVIQDRYRKVPALDPRRQEMQREIAALYARHGMSMGTQMAVGCLPLLLTMPFLIAFYRVLQVSIELRGAPFLWISDLSQKDPLFITPLLMGGSMFLMQRMTPSAMDPAQQRMMMLMPVVLMGMFLWAPAGLNLYWLASNVCSIVQQGVTLRIIRSGEKTPPRKGRRG
jgi:YidC/Oxa1 family membrane protein insertase